MTEGLALNFLTRLLWAYASRQMPRELATLAEPPVGNPPRISDGGKLISQDLADSVLEYGSFAAVAEGTVCELGGGYGRTAFATASLAPVKRYIMVDIPPALAVAQEYLGAVFPGRRHFAFRPWTDFAEVREAFEAADSPICCRTSCRFCPTIMSICSSTFRPCTKCASTRSRITLPKFTGR